NSETVFDDIEGEDEELEISKNHKININIPQDCENLEEKVQAALYKALEAYWDLSVDDDLLSILLDPQHKNLEFASTTDHKFVEDTLIHMCDIECIQDLQETSQADFIDTIESHNLDEELSHNEINIESDACIWWAAQKDRFPTLAHFARENLAIQATFTP
ncbi:3847_t:CDS:2, partial [Cetraspora pellucida]